MPRPGAYIPQGALPLDAQDKCFAPLTGLLLQHQRAGPANPVARALTRVFVHPPAVHAGGSPAVASPSATGPVNAEGAKPPIGAGTRSLSLLVGTAQ